MRTTDCADNFLDLSQEIKGDKSAYRLLVNVLKGPPKHEILLSASAASTGMTMRLKPENLCA